MINCKALKEGSERLFESPLGADIKKDITRAVNDFSMIEKIKRGVTVGFSGGSDSVLLLIFLWNLKKEYDFALKAIHINHCIRGEEADRDEEFAKSFCDSLGIDIECRKVDIPRISKERKRGLEETAREERYRIFADAIRDDSDISYVATAHNATDNAETVIFNLLRGSGTAGLCGISAVRDLYIRPIIYVSKENISKLLIEAQIPFVHDSTNDSVDYTRNYIRHEILPRFSRINPYPERSFSRISENLKTDSDCLNEIADKTFEQINQDGRIRSSDLRPLHKAIIVRVLASLFRFKSQLMLEKVHLDKITELLFSSDNFKVSVPGGYTFTLENGEAYFSNDEEKSIQTIEKVYLNGTFTEIPALGIAISVSDDKYEDFSSNVYKFSIQADINSAIILGELFVRTKNDGDSYRFGGMTRKLKKLFNDKKIPVGNRSKIPIICDEKGILWVPGFGVRDDGNKDGHRKWITVYTKQF